MQELRQRVTEALGSLLMSADGHANLSYDSATNRITTAGFAYDAVNRLTNLADSASQNFPHTYDSVNRLTARSAPNGITSNYVYDDLSRLTALNHTAGGDDVDRFV